MPLLLADLIYSRDCKLNLRKNVDTTPTYWSAQEADYENSTHLETSFLNDAFLFTAPEAQGQLVFSITALWTGYSDVSGSVTYAFRTAA